MSQRKTIRNKSQIKPSTNSSDDVSQKATSAKSELWGLSYYDIQLFIVALLIRLWLIFYGDILSPEGVKYQDIDYEVFTNASRYIYNGGIAFDCDTYRYTPLLAWILQPSIFIHFEFGKILFIIIDIIGAYLLRHIIKYHLQKIHRENKINAMLWVSIIWLFNPIIFTISSRGSCDSIIILLVLATFYYILNEEWYKAGIIYGLAVHFRIYPFIYALAFVLFITHLDEIKNKNQTKRVMDTLTKMKLNMIIKRMIFNCNVWSFGLMSLLSFMCLNIICYAFMGGNIYLQESYFYHFTRIDDQHNFSIYFLFLKYSKLSSYDDMNVINNCWYNVNNDLGGYCIAPLVSRFSFVLQFRSCCYDIDQLLVQSQLTTIY